VRAYLPPCTEWTEVNINSKLVDIVARVSGRVFVGADLAQDPEYLEMGANYTVYLIEAVRAIKSIRPWLRPFLVPRLPEIKRLRDVEKRAAKHLEPIVRERMEAGKSDPNYQQPDDMVCTICSEAWDRLTGTRQMQWLLNRSEGHGIVGVEQLARQQLGLIFAAIHTTTMTTTNILYTLATTPEYVEPMREEIRTAMADNEGTINSRALGQMIKLDSFMKEVGRLFPPGLSK